METPAMTSFATNSTISGNNRVPTSKNSGYEFTFLLFFDKSKFREDWKNDIIKNTCKKTFVPDGRDVM